MKFNITKMSICFFILAISLLGFIVCKGNQNFLHVDTSKEALSLEELLKKSHIPKYNYQVVSSYPHDNRSFTEGLFLQGDYAYESTGLYGHSSLRKVQIKSGKILQKYSLPRQYFAEGITALNNQIYMLTYHEHTGFVYDINTFKVKNTFTYPGEGWGLTTDGNQLIMSNGSDSISFINPKTFKIERSIVVKAGKDSVKSLNELEFIDGLIYANVWPTSIIVVFSPKDGQIIGWLNIKELKPVSACMECVANGIAYDEKNKLLMVTGKNWPYMYEIKTSRPWSLQLDQ